MVVYYLTCTSALSEQKREQVHCQNKTKREQEKENTLNRINVTTTHLSIICYEIFIVTFDLDPLDDKATQHYLCLEDTPQHHLKQNTILVPFAVRFPKLTAQVIFDQRSLLEQEYFSFSLISNFTVTNMSLNSSKHAWVKNPETNYIRLHTPKMNACLSSSPSNRKADWSNLITLYMLAIYVLTHTVHYHHG